MLLFIFETIGVIAFAISGATAAIKKGMDLLGVLFVGFITALGGGIIRDILLGITPPKSFSEPIFPLIAIITSLLTFLFFGKKFFLMHHDQMKGIILFIDTIGLAVFTVAGTQMSQLIYENSVFMNVLMGVMTGIGGGILRDVFLCQLAYVFTKHFYATAAIIGAFVSVILSHVVGTFAAGIAGAIIIFLLRIFAAYYKWELPKYREQ